MLSNEPVDDLTKDIEVATVKAIISVRATQLCHGHVETKLQGKV